MAKLSTETRQMCPELKECMKAFEELSYSRGYGEVFSDYINWLIWQHQFPPNENNPIGDYKDKEQKLFLTMYQNLHQEIRKRVLMWLPKTEENRDISAWYDGLGRMCEAITSKYKSSLLGQYFTPEPIVTMMAQITHSAERGKFQKILDPACGSGRMGMATATQALIAQSPCWVTMNDLDPICTKITAINMAMHGIVGEVTCMNGLDIEGHSYKFGYRIEPILAKYPTDQWSYIQMVTYMKTGQDAQKQYILSPISYEETFLKQANDQLLEEFEERKKIADEQERKKALDDFKSSVQERMKGSLFEGDNSFTDNLVLPSHKKNKKTSSPKTKKDSGDDEQGSLF